MQKESLIKRRLLSNIRNSSAAQSHLMKAFAGHMEYIMAVSAYKSLFSKIDYSKTIAEAFSFALEKHEGQYYLWKKNKKLPYSYHLCKCALNTALFSCEDKHIVIALWHDLLEDNKATKEEIINELKRYRFNADEIIDSLAKLDKGNSSSPKEYFSKILHNEDACLVKAADIIANLNECITRFDEMITSEQRFWIYSYLIEIPKFFLDSKLLPTEYKAAILPKISLLLSSLPDKNKEELRHYPKEAVQNE